MNVPSAGRAKLPDCNAHEDKKVSKQLLKLCVPKLRRAAQGTVNCSRMMTRTCSREGAARTECRCSAGREQAARQEGAVARSSCELSTELFWGSAIFRAASQAQTKARLRALSQELTEADRRLFSDEWDDDARGVRTDGGQFQ